MNLERRLFSAHTFVWTGTHSSGALATVLVLDNIQSTLEMGIDIVVAPTGHDGIVLAPIKWMAFSQNVIGLILWNTRAADTVMGPFDGGDASHAVVGTERGVSNTAATVGIKGGKDDALEVGIQVLITPTSDNSILVARQVSATIGSKDTGTAHGHLRLVTIVFKILVGNVFGCKERSALDEHTETEKNDNTEGDLHGVRFL